jgi:GH25 family lysozyme M1 (1,4-beta-N-acetylmuramidase)
MDWQTCSNAGANFAFCRAGSISIGGALYTDYQFERNAGLAPDYMPTGFYWYFRPQHSPTNQADYFCDLIEDTERLLPPVLDMEQDGGLSDSACGDRCAEFIGRVYERLMVWPIVYTRGYFWNTQVSYRSIFDECDLWVARYTRLPKPWDNPGDNPMLQPNYWDDWTFWQWSADNNGRGAEFGAQSRSIDLDYFNGEDAEFAKYINKPTPEPVYPDDIGVKIDIDGIKYHGRIGKV